MNNIEHNLQVLHSSFQIFNARQLALKLISNVTYGYTAAGFSGRMPCAELADSIVQCGRRTLENAISFVNLHKKWNAKVIYGDTDRYHFEVFLSLCPVCCNCRYKLFQQCFFYSIILHVKVYVGCIRFLCGYVKDSKIIAKTSA